MKHFRDSPPPSCHVNSWKEGRRDLPAQLFYRQPSDTRSAGGEGPVREQRERLSCLWSPRSKLCVLAHLPRRAVGYKEAQKFGFRLKSHFSRLSPTPDSLPNQRVCVKAKKGPQVPSTQRLLSRASFSFLMVVAGAIWRWLVTEENTRTGLILCPPPPPNHKLLSSSPWPVPWTLRCLREVSLGES